MQTSLMAAVFGQKVDMVRVILESKADANLRSRPWHSSRSDLVIFALAFSYSSIIVLNGYYCCGYYQAKTAEEWAVARGYNAVVEVFRLVSAPALRSH